MSKICKNDRKKMLIVSELETTNCEFVLRDASSVNLVKSVLASGTDIDAKDADGYTALHYAVSDNNLEKAKLLIEKGANVNARARYGITPRYICSLLRHAEMFNFLIKHKAKCSFPERSEFEKYWKVRMLKVYNPVNAKIVQHFATEAGLDCDFEAVMAGSCRLGKRAKLKQLGRIIEALEKAAALGGYKISKDARV